MACKRNSLLITENEKIYIKNLYGLLTEDEMGKKTIEAGSTFAPGKYSNISDEGLNELNMDLEEVKSWIMENLSKYKIRSK
jgi:hypothetical protein